MLNVARELSLEICVWNFVWEFSLGSARLGAFASFCFSLDLALGNYRLRIFGRELSFRNFRLVTFVAKLSCGSFRLRNVVWNIRLGTFTGEFRF